MEYFKINPHKPQKKIIEHAVKVLKEGGVIVYPTNTLYGLGVNAFDKKALDRLFVIKQRTPFQPVSLMLSSCEQLFELYAEVNEEQRAHLQKLLPGKITALLKGRFDEKLPHLTSGSADGKDRARVGFRVAELPVVQQLVNGLGSPLTSTSANLSGMPNARTIQEIIAQFGDRLDLILDAGPAPDIRGSTIIDFTKDPYLIMREGAVTLKDLQKLLPDVAFKKRKQQFVVTFVCSGNICRSPMAEAILEEFISKTRFKSIIRVQSAGTLDLTSGPAHPLTLTIASEHGIDLSHHQARPIQPKILEESDLVICMAVNHYEYLRNRYPQFKEKLVLLKEWHRRNKLSNPSVPDPIGHGKEYFEQVFNEIRNEIKRILPHLFTQVKAFMAYNDIKLK